MTLLTCVKCGFETNDGRTFQRHIDRKTSCVPIEKQKEFTCIKCGDSYLTAKFLENHSLKCTGTHGLQCPTCKKEFNERSTRNKHIAKNKCVPKDAPRDKPEHDTLENQLPQEPIVPRKTPSGKKGGQCHDCDKWASYNFPGLVRKFCADCRLPGMIDVQAPRCSAPDCVRIPNYIDKDMQKFCSDHKSETSTPIRSPPKCDHPDCNKAPTYSLFEGSPARVCADHKSPNMVSKRRTCSETDCEVAPVFGAPGHKTSHCSKHKQAGQIRQPNKRCTHSILCNDLATHGFPPSDRQTCELHASPDMIDLLNKECTSCNLKTLVNAQGMCQHCDPETFKYVRLAKQREVEEYIRDNTDFFDKRYEPRVDRQVVSGCLKERPDFYFDLGDAIMIVEADEHMHRDREQVCEISRMYNVGQAHGGVPTLFLRYNMDRYNGGGRKQKSNEERLRDLVEAMEDVRANWKPTLDEDDPSMSVTWCKYLFYDHAFPEGIHRVELPITCT